MTDHLYDGFRKLLSEEYDKLSSEECDIRLKTYLGYKTTEEICRDQLLDQAAEKMKDRYLSKQGRSLLELALDSTILVKTKR